MQVFVVLLKETFFFFFFFKYLSNWKILKINKKSRNEKNNRHNSLVFFVEKSIVTRQKY